ncbi:MAG: GTP cyclohydrolase II [Caldilineaceae bacterium]|nr:GTP cyclohydrolase II [Caldilineaceae bacterium]
MNRPAITRTTCARIPTEFGEFKLCHYVNDHDRKEHLAVVMGDVSSAVTAENHAEDGVLVRVHSECFTGDVLGSRRCDCGEQLARAMALIAAEGRGVIVYLRQEGRGIGLENKLRAYNLQDQGYDTVDANLMLGHQADEREYWAAAGILEDLGVTHVRLLTNNPAKIEHLRALGVDVCTRVPIEPTVHADNAGYLETKVARMRHMLGMTTAAPVTAGATAPHAPMLQDLRTRLAQHTDPHRPFVTLSYAQSLDGSIAAQPGAPTRLSGPAAMAMTHAVRAAHDAILVGIGTVLADNPRLTVRLVDGASPRPVVLDSKLRMPPEANVMTHPAGVVIATNGHDSTRDRQLLAQGATLLDLPSTPAGQIDLDALLRSLAELGIHSVMVEGGAAVIDSFLRAQLVDYLLVTVAPTFLGGVHAVGAATPVAAGTPLPRLADVRTQTLGDDIIISGVPTWAAVPA